MPDFLLPLAAFTIGTGSVVAYVVLAVRIVRREGK